MTSLTKYGIVIVGLIWVFQITPTFSCLVSDYGEYDTTIVDKMIKAVVTMEFAID